MIKYFIFFSVSLLVSCTQVGPNYQTPEVKVKDKWDFEENFQLAENVENKWWLLLKDEDLNRLIAVARQDNPDIQAAALRIIEARAVLGIAQGQMYPQQQQAVGGASINQISDNAPNSAAADSYYKNYTIGSQVGWEIDFWGKFGRLVNASKAQIEVELASFDNFQVLLYSEIASLYIQIRILEEQIKVAKANAVLQERNMKIAKVQFDNGDVTELDFQQAKIIYNNTLSTIPVFEANKDKAKNAISVLLGERPGETNNLISDEGTVPTFEGKLAIAAPASLLRRRADIRLAERLMAGQSELIGVAQADLYPHVSLVGSIGFNSSNSSLTKNNNSQMSDIFSKESLFYGMGPSFSWDFLNYGRIKNRVRIEDARFEQLAENYYKTVLQAQLEVENAMTDFHKNKESLGFLGESVKAATRSVSISETLYKNGESKFTRVLDSLQLLLSQENNYVLKKGEVVLNFIELYKGLGGGWALNDQRLPKEETLKRMRSRTDWGEILTPVKEEKGSSK